VGDLNSGGKSGAVKYKFTSLSEGEHNIRIKAWDVFNNFSETEVYFTVVNESDELYLRNIYNYPNPFSSSTTFTFQHNANNAIDVKIKIYTVAGRLIKEIDEYSVMDRFVRIDWDGRDEDGNSLANGTYLYKIVAQTTDGSFKKSALGKLSIIR
jgi:flagellar hook assembly protein FlgD